MCIRCLECGKIVEGKTGSFASCGCKNEAFIDSANGIVRVGAMNMSKVSLEEPNRRGTLDKSPKQQEIEKTQIEIEKLVEPALRKAMIEYKEKYGFDMEDMWLWKRLNLSVLISVIGTDLLVGEWEKTLYRAKE